ncbi:MAG TPA: nuclear transport factor 2 family protein [Candidatus Binataceae bacterium]
MKTTDELVMELADREAIRDLPVRYCDCVWQNDLKTMVELFAEDGTFVVKGRAREATTKGRVALRKMYEQALGDVSPRPYIHNHVVNLQSKTKATGRCYVELRSAARDMEWIGTGYYDDEYVKVGEQWKFATRRFTSIRMPAPAAPSASKA